MLMTIVMTILVASITATIMLRFRDEEKTSMAKIVFGSVAVGLSASVLNNYLVPDHPGLAWLFMLICLVFIGALMYQWHKQGSDLVEFLCFTALTLIVGGIACAAAAHYKSAQPMLLSVWIPIFAIGYYGVTAMKFHAARNTLSDDERAGLLKQEKNETVDEMDSNAAKFHRLMTLVAAVTVIALAGATGLTLGIADNSTLEDKQAEEPVITASAASTDRDPEFVQEWASNAGNKQNADFPAVLEEEAAKNGGVKDGDAFERACLKCAKKDVRWTAILAWSLGLREEIEWDSLWDGVDYPTQDGLALYYKVEGALDTSTLQRGDLPTDVVNTGMDDGNFVVNGWAGISGDITGTWITTQDGKREFGILDRCSNIVLRPNDVPNPKDVPRGDTDEPTPPENNPEKDPAVDPVNRGNAQKGGGQDKSTDGAGENQPKDPRTEHPTGSGNDNNHGYSDPKTVTPSNPAPSKPAVTDSKPMDYSPDPVTNRGPADSSKKPTSSEGDGEFTPSD